MGNRAMTVKRFTKDHAGVTYVGVRDDDRTVTGSITMGDRKLTLTGFPKINRTQGSYKHGKEVQITIWAEKGTTYEKPRVQFNPGGSKKEHKWDTVEVFFAPEVWQDLIYEYLNHMPPPKGSQ